MIKDNWFDDLLEYIIFGMTGVMVLFFIVAYVAFVITAGWIAVLVPVVFVAAVLVFVGIGWLIAKLVDI